jgi:predicted alpha/beta-fold hydrolase
VSEELAFAGSEGWPKRFAAGVPDFRPPVVLRNAHLQTVLPSIVRRVDGIQYTRRRIDTPDGDFLDLDIVDSQRARDGRVAIVTHGLEGSAQRPYVRGMARALSRRGWTVVAINLRGCSGEPNRLPRAYHSGATEDLAAVVAHVFDRGTTVVGLVGFSLGANLTLKYLGEAGEGVDPRVVGAVAFSVPCDLASSAECMARPAVRPYMRYFVRSLAPKAAQKAAAFPGVVPSIDVGRMRTFKEFDDAFTAPLHGFRDAADYWARASAGPALAGIRVPALIINAADDPFLSPACTPREAIDRNPVLALLAPERGGHVGFADMRRGRWRREIWSERVAGAFLDLAHARRRPV